MDTTPAEHKLADAVKLAVEALESHFERLHALQRTVARLQVHAQQTEEEWPRAYLVADLADLSQLLGIAHNEVHKSLARVHLRATD